MSYLDLAKQIEARLAAVVPTPHPPQPTRELRPGQSEFAEAVAAVADSSLAYFGRSNVLLEVRVRWWPETLWFVADVPDAERLGSHGVARHRIWTVNELITLLAGSPLGPHELSTLMVARREFNGEVVAVIPRPARSPSGTA